MATYFIPFLQDAELLKTRTFPAAGATNYSSSIDLKAAQPNKHGNQMVKILAPSCPNHTNNSIYNTITIQHSTDDSSFEDVNPLHQVKMLGVTTTGYAGDSYYITLPPSINRYIRIAVYNDASGGTNTAQTIYFGLVFGSP